MICILHGYLLEGSGSNLWTRSILESLCREGRTVHLMAQENHPERYPFIVETRNYEPGGGVEIERHEANPYPGACILHKPVLGDTLPVYVWDHYEEFEQVVPMVELSDSQMEDYLERNVRALLRVVEEHGITALHANHSVMMSEVARRVSEKTGVPFAVMPHGSGLEYAVKKDRRFLDMAERAFAAAGRIFVIGDEIRGRVLETLGAVPELERRFRDLHLGVDTSQFEPVAREERAASIAGLEESVREMPRGRTPEQGRRMREALRPSMELRELKAALELARDYDGKAPDAEVESRLAQVDWANDPTLLFVGRLISTKGIHGVIAALPFLLRERPDLRLIVVGHGPLREPMEAMLWALEHGETELLETIVAHGRLLEGSPEGESGGTALTQAARFYESLREQGRLEEYLEAARAHVRPERVVFTGYLAHPQLRYLFPCCDAALFPSVVREAGPLVFLEALASGAYPLGTYFGGMRASIDTVAEALPPGAAEPMKLSADPERTVEDIVNNVPLALEMGDRYKDRLYRLARDRYDWSSVAKTLVSELESM